MRIALFNSLFPALGIGGSEMSVYYLSLGLKRLGHDVLVISLNDRTSTVVEVKDGIDVVRLGSKAGYEPNIYAAPRLNQFLKRKASGKETTIAARAKSYLDEFAPNVIHTNVIGGLQDIWRLGRRQGLCVVHTLRSYTQICHRRMLRGEAPCARQCRDCSTPQRRIARDQSSIVDGVVGISAHILNVHRDAGWFADVRKSAVIANSYEVAPDKTQVSNDEAYDLGFIGRLHQTKGIELLLQSLKQLAAQNGRVPRTLIAGSGNAEYIEYLKATYDVPGVTYGGYVDSNDFFRVVKFCVVPSLWFEPFGRVFIEALHHGVPVIGSIRGGGAEILNDRVGWLFDPADADKLASCLAEAITLDDPAYEKLSAQCLEHAAQFSVEKIAKDYENFYKSALSAGE